MLHVTQLSSSEHVRDIYPHLASLHLSIFDKCSYRISNSWSGKFEVGGFISNKNDTIIYCILYYIDMWNSKPAGWYSCLPNCIPPKRLLCFRINAAAKLCLIELSYNEHKLHFCCRLVQREMNATTLLEMKGWYSERLNWFCLCAMCNFEVSIHLERVTIHLHDQMQLDTLSWSELMLRSTTCKPAQVPV